MSEDIKAKNPIMAQSSTQFADVKVNALLINGLWSKLIRG